MNDFTLYLLTTIKERDHLTLTTLGAIIDIDPFNLVKPINDLISIDYLEICPDAVHSKGEPLSLNTPFQLTYKGIIAIDQERKAKKHFKYQEFRAWATLFIAVIALIISIISLL